MDTALNNTGDHFHARLTVAVPELFHLHPVFFIRPSFL